MTVRRTVTSVNTQRHKNKNVVTAVQNVQTHQLDVRWNDMIMLLMYVL